MQKISKPKETCLSVLCCFLWLSNLSDTNSHYIVYLLCAVTAIVCLSHNYQNPAPLPRRTSITITILSVVYSSAVILANHNIFYLFDEHYDHFAGFHILCTFLGGFVVAYHILRFGLQHFPCYFTQNNRSWKPRYVFLLSFGTASVINLLYFWNVDYPGVMTPDSFSAVSQILTGNYNNTSPYWHTKAIEFFFRIGYVLFENINTAVACFTVAQVLFVSACFAYVLMTFYEAGFPKWFFICTGIVYILLPYNIAYSVTLWKDIPFGMCACLLAASLLRIIRRIGSNSKCNYIIFAAAAIGFSLLRTNGWAAFLVLFCSMLVLVRKQYKKLIFMMLVVLVFTGILIGPYLSAKNVSKTDWVETLAVPFQQIACVVACDRWMEPYEEQMLSEIFDLEVIKERYDPHIVDPIKFDALKRDKLEFFQENWNEYVYIWLSLGKRYPNDYATAYIELTKGYWNGGYNGGELYWTYLTGVGHNELGIRHTVRENAIRDFFERYIFYMEWNGITPVFYSIGLHVWILIACLVINKEKNRPEFLLSLPCLVLIIGLWIGTPVYSEFRYGYPLLVSLPVILGATIFHVQDQATETDVLEQHQ